MFVRNLFLSTAGTVLVALTCGGFIASAAESDSGFPVITPTPRHMAWTDPSGPAWLQLSELKSIAIQEDCRDAIAGGIDQFTAKLRELHVDEAAIPKLDAQFPATLEPGRIYLGIMPNPNLEARLAALPAPKAEGYKLLVDTNGVLILGRDLRGLYYGLVTLRQLVDAEGRIARVAISDWPDMPLRGTYVAGNATEERIREFAALKLNFALFECGEFFSLDNDEIRARWENTFALCRKHLIEPVLELQSLGWGHSVLVHHPEAAEAMYLEKKRFEVKDGAVQSPDPPVAPPVAIANAGFEDGATLAGWSTDGKGEGAAIDTEGAHAGKGSLRVTRTTLGTVRVFQRVPVLPQTTYELSCFLRTKEVTEGTAYIEAYGIEDDGSLGLFLGPSGHVKGDQDWKRMAVSFYSNNYTKIEIYVRIQDAVGTAWFDDVALSGLPSMNPLANVLITQVAPVVVQDEAGITTYEEGKDYRIVPTPVAYPFGLGQPLRIEAVSGGRIKDGTAVLLSYHQAPPGSVTCCPSEPQYQEYMRTTIRNVVQYLHPKYIHIGHDEPRTINRDRRCTARNMSNSEIFADDIKRMNEFAHEADPAIRLMMWSDAVNPHHNGPSLKMNDAASLIPKDVIQCPWWYDYPDSDERIEKSITFFLNQGFDITGSPWFKHSNVYQWAEALYKHRKDNPHVLGLLYTSWTDAPQDLTWQALTTAAQYAWIVDKMPLDEFLRR